MIKSFRYIVLLLSVLLLASCTTTAQQSETERVVIQTEKGEVSVVENPKRIVTFDYALVDYLMAMDIELETIGAALPSAPDYQQAY